VPASADMGLQAASRTSTVICLPRAARAAWIFFRLHSVLGIEHTANYSLVDPKAARQFGVVDPLIPHRHVERQFRREPKRHGHQALTTPRSRGCRDLFPAGQTDREIGPEGVHGFFHCLTIVFAVGRDARKIDELNQYAAVSASREFCGLSKSGHWFTPHRSCGSIFRSRHIFASRSRPISFFRSLRVVNSSPKYRRPWLPFPGRPRTGKRPSCAAPTSVRAARIPTVGRFALVGRPILAAAAFQAARAG
jgi:hypothetical protein